MARNIHMITVPDEIWRLLEQAGEVGNNPPESIGLDILIEGAQAKLDLMVEEAEKEARHLEAELTMVRARLAGLNGSPKAPRSPVQPSPAQNGAATALTVREAVREVLNIDKHRTWTTGEVLEQLLTLGQKVSYPQVNSALRVLIRAKEAKSPARGQYVYRRRPSNHG